MNKHHEVAWNEGDGDRGGHQEGKEGELDGEEKRIHHNDEDNDLQSTSFKAKTGSQVHNITGHCDISRWPRNM